MLLLVQNMRPLIALPAEVVLQQGQAAAGLFVILKGRCEVVQLDGASSQPALDAPAVIDGDNVGRRVVWLRRAASRAHKRFVEPSFTCRVGEGTQIAILKHGDFCGEVSLLSGTLVSATVRSLGYSSLVVLLAATFTSLLERFPSLRDEVERCHAAQSSRYSTTTPRKPRNSRRTSSGLPSFRGAQGAVRVSVWGSRRHLPGHLSHSHTKEAPAAAPEAAPATEEDSSPI